MKNTNIHAKLTLEMKGIEPLTSRMQIVRSTPELHPLCSFCYEERNTVPPLGLEPRTFRLLSERSTAEP